MSIDWDDDYTPPQGVTITSLAQAVSLIDEWAKAYDELRREYVRLHKRLTQAEFDADVKATLALNFEALLKHRDKL